METVKELLVLLLLFGGAVLVGALVMLVAEARVALAEAREAVRRANRIMDHLDDEMAKIDRITARADTTVAGISETVELYNRLVAKPAIWLRALEGFVRRTWGRREERA